MECTYFFLSYSKQNKIRSLKMVGFIVEGLMPIGSEEDPEDVDEDSPSRVSIEIKKNLREEMTGYTKLFYI